MNKKRYIEITDDVEKRLIRLSQLGNHPVPVYIPLLYIPDLNLDLAVESDLTAPSDDVVEVKSVLVPGYAWKANDIIYVEHLNFDGYLETRVLDRYSYPQIFLREVEK